MKVKAISKLRSEIESNKANPYIQLIGQFLINHIEAHPDDSAKIMAAEKTIGKSLEAMKVEAKKKQHNGMSMLTDQEGYGIVLKYFGITVAVSLVSTVPAVHAQSVTDVPAPKASPVFSASLDEFL